MNLEDALRATMREHDDEAPQDLTAVITRREPQRGRRPDFSARAAMALVAAVVVALALVVAVVARDHRMRQTADGKPAPGTTGSAFSADSECPVSITSENVPVRRHSGGYSWSPSEYAVDAAANASSAMARPRGPSDRLVPAEAPREAIICRYQLGPSPYPAMSLQASSTNTFHLKGSRTVSTGLAAAAQRWFRAARFDASTCRGTPELRINPPDYRVRLHYADRDVWLAGDDRPQCPVVSNGRFTSSLNIVGEAAAAYVSGRWHG